jgi:exopolyphosphatase / guanosine-5'-triphosphate,3'-diphosphate pyrophosphatase
MRRIQAIDIGTNSVRSIIVDVDDAGGYQLVDDEKEYTRLGRGLGEDGVLSDDAMARTTETLRRMLSIAQHFGVDETHAIATAAVRRAANGAEYVKRVKDELGLPIEIISEEEEGRLAFVSASRNFDLTGRNAIIDIGGGSVEVVRSASRQIEFIRSLPIGAVTLAERFRDRDPMPRETFEEMKRFVRASLEEGLAEDGGPVVRLVGTGGSVNSLSAMVAAAQGHPSEPLQGFELTLPDAVHMLAKLKRSSAQERLEIPGLPPSRVDIIIPGTLLVTELMRHFQVNVLSLNTKGIREGLILDLIARGHGEQVLDRMQAVYAFAERCRFERPHSLHVRDLALSLFDQLAEPLELDAASRPLLETAAILHDVGYLIGYEQHPKHSYHLITYSDLPGFSARELHMIAAVASYHSGPKPKPGHESLQGLSKPDRREVKRLAGILKLADGFDRTRDQQVEAVTAEVSGDVFRFTARGGGDLGVNIHRAIEKADLLAQVFERPVEIVQAGR